MCSIHLGLSQETVFQDLKNSYDGVDRQSSESHSVEPGLGCLPLFISRKALVANTAPHFLSGLSLFIESVLFTLCVSINLMMPQVSLFVQGLGFMFFFFILFCFFGGLLKNVFIFGYCSGKLRSELLMFSFKLLGFSFLSLIKSPILHGRNVQIA